MNRRGFLSALALAPVAAVVAPAAIARPAYAAGGMVSGIAGKWGYLGEIGPELILPPEMMANPARLMQSVFNDAFGATAQGDRTFDEMAAYCDEIVEAIDA